MTGLFDTDAQRVYAIPPGADFLAGLARALADAADLKSKPDALADALVYLPNRRSARAFAFALHQAAGPGAVILPPDIRALGDLESAEEAPHGAEEAVAGLGPPLDPDERLAALARLCAAYFAAKGEPAPVVSSLAAAREIARLLDQAALSEDADWSALPDLAGEADLAGHWARSVDFLKIVTEAWPQWLAERGALDPFERRARVAQAIAQRWAADPPRRPVLIAGSTGATPASRILMRAALDLPLGRIVLPGLDAGAQPQDWAAIAAEPSHPQHAFAKTLDDLGLDPASVALWPGAGETPHASARRKLLGAALAPAGDTADWLARIEDISGDDAPKAFVARALDGLSIIETPDEAREAMAAALLLREALETPGRAAALVTPDAGVSRRVCALLKRWGVDAAPSAGVPVLRTPQGALLALVLDWLADPGEPVALAALAKHPRLDASDGASALERLVLRGPRRWDALDALAARLAQAQGSDADRTCAAGLLDRLSGALDAAASEPAAVDAACAAIDALAPDGETWAGAGGQAAAQLVGSLRALDAALGPLDPASVRALLEGLAAGRAVPPEAPGDPRLNIWGPLEARLQSADLIVLAGLNEEVWPARPAADAFLPRRFRPPLGLPDPETRLGLAAHDFAQLACAPRVAMILADRRDDAPAVASRWVWRLKTLARGALGDAAEQALRPPPGRDPLAWATALERPRDKLPATLAQPRPKPPVEARPNALSVTRIDVLQRDPFAIYAERILRLAPLDPLAGPLDARRSGTAIHDALEAFETAPDQTPETLLALMEDRLLDAGAAPADLAAMRAVRRETARWYVDWRSARAPQVARAVFEKRGAWTTDIAGAPFTLTARADRIEILRDGRLAILDFKTGDPPSDGQIASELDQQMPLQALIAAAGGFEDVPAAEVAELVYVAVRANASARLVGESGRSAIAGLAPPELAARARAGLERLVGRFRDPGAAYLSAPRVQFVKYDYGYNRLARRDEWTSETRDA